MIDLPTCACGRIMDGVQTQCWPCESGNIRAGFYCPPDARGPIYGASLAGPSWSPGGPTPTAGITVDWQSSGDQAPGDALRAVEAVWLTPSAGSCEPCPDCAAVADRSEALAARVDDLLEQNDAQAIENSDLARQVVSLKGHLETMAAQVRQGKAGT
jgi:hypothetical protein